MRLKNERSKMIEPVYFCESCLQNHLWDELRGPKDGGENLEDLECPICGEELTEL